MVSCGVVACHVAMADPCVSGWRGAVRGPRAAASGDACKDTNAPCITVMWPVFSLMELGGPRQPSDITGKKAKHTNKHIPWGHVLKQRACFLPCSENVVCSPYGLHGFICYVIPAFGSAAG